MGQMAQEFVGNFEVVHVIGKGRLIDAESYERTIWTRDGGSLQLGFYAVCWSAAGLEGTFDDNATFRGPFRRREQAWAAIEQARARQLATMPAGSAETIAAEGNCGAPLQMTAPTGQAGPHLSDRRPK